MIFNGVNLSAQFSQNAALVSGTGAYFQNPVAGLYLEQFGLPGYGEGLRNGLPFAYGKRFVLICMNGQRRIQKKMSWNLSDGSKDSFVFDSFSFKVQYHTPSEALEPKIIRLFIHIRAQGNFPIKYLLNFAVRKKSSFLFGREKMREGRVKLLFFLSLQLAAGMLLTCCSFIDPPEKVPSYIQVDSFSFVTADSTGFNTQKITDVWIYVNNQIMGTYQVPTGRIPALADGTSEITIQAGVFADGIRANRVYYPFYQAYVTRMNLEKGKLSKVKPVFRYGDRLKKPFVYYQDFETSDSGFSKGRYGNAELERPNHDAGTAAASFGARYGKLSTRTDEDIIEYSNQIFVPLRQNGMPVYLEFDYRSTCNLQVGLEGYVGNQAPQPYFDLVLLPAENWTKMYVSLSEETQKYFNNARFRFFLRTVPQPGAGNSFSIDNIRLINY